MTSSGRRSGFTYNLTLSYHILYLIASSCGQVIAIHVISSAVRGARLGCGSRGWRSMRRGWTCGVDWASWWGWWTRGRLPSLSCRRWFVPVNLHLKLAKLDMELRKVKLKQHTYIGICIYNMKVLVHAIFLRKDCSKEIQAIFILSSTVIFLFKIYLPGWYQKNLQQAW